MFPSYAAKCRGVLWSRESDLVSLSELNTSCGDLWHSRFLVNSTVCTCWLCRSLLQNHAESGALHAYLPSLEE